MYIQKGATKIFVHSGGFFVTSRDRITCNLDYIEVPIEFNFKLGNLYSIGIGSYVAFSVNKSAVLSSTDPSENGYNELEKDFNNITIDEDISSVDFGLNFSSTRKIGDNFLIGIKSSIGLSDISEVPITWPLDDSTPFGYQYSPVPKQSWVNRCFSVSFGYMFGR